MAAKSPVYTWITVLAPVLFVISSESVAQRVATSTGVQKIDCYPDSQSPTRQECSRRGCLFEENPTPGEPYCSYDPNNQGYRQTRREDTANGFRVHLQALGAGHFPRTIQHVVVDVEKLSDDILRIKFDDEDDSNRYKVPAKLNLPQGGPPSNPKYDVIVTSENFFAFKVIRRDTNATIWDTGVGGLVMSDQFLQLATRLASENVYGLGENLHDTFKHQLNATWPAFARDQPPSFSQFENLYGVHPFYTCLEDSEGNAHGVLLLNSNAQDYELSPLPMLTYRTIGGILDFYFFFGPSPEEVIQQYTGVIGRPMMPPYWALGFQLSRYGYNHVSEMRLAVEDMQKYEIPQDVQYADIDYMSERRDFTFDPINFADLNSFFKELQAGGMRTIIMLDPALVSNYTDYEPYEVMKRIGGNVKWPNEITPPDGSADTDGSILGYVWPQGKTVFPDFFKNRTRQAWKDLIINFMNNVSFDGIWIDMNEPASFGTNEERPFNWPEDVKPYWSLKCPVNDWEDPPYRTKAAYMHDYGDKKGRLSDKTICMSTVQGEAGEFRHYDVHSLYGWSETPITLEAARAATGERSVVISRSTFPGSGKYAGHWLGDNQSKWSDLRHSIIGMLEFNLFGIPYIGADVCGFFGDSDAELCLRWMQLGAFYPFSRNHNTIGTKRQDPGYYGETVAKASREILEIRYWMLPYLYTLFHQAHTHGSTVVRPLHHEFPTDGASYGIDRQFLWGPALLISPILEQGQTSLTFYLPPGVWYNAFTGNKETGPQTKTVDNLDLSSKPALHVRGGHILPFQRPARNTTASRRNQFKLIVALDEQQSASGSLFWDDGVSVDTFERGEYFLAEYTATSNSLAVNVVHNNVGETASLTYGAIEIWGVKGYVHDITITTDGGKTDWAFDWNDQPDKEHLSIINLKIPIAETFNVTWLSVDTGAVSRIDCWPERQGGVDLPDSAGCQRRGCVYQPHSDPAVPDCFFPQQNYGYSVNGDWQTTQAGRKVNLRRVGSGPFGYELPNIVFTVEEYGDKIVHFKFDSPAEDRYKVPMNLNLPTTRPSARKYRFEVTSNDTFAFRIVREATGAVLFDTSVGGLVLHDQFLQIATRLATSNVYGMGENVHSTFKRDLWYHTYGLFGRDQPTKTDETLTHYYNHYGTHPFYQCVEEDGKAHGVLFLNSHPQDYQFSPLPMLTYRTIGGILDFYVFVGDNPEDVVSLYTGAVGRPVMPPYWALGFQLCKYGYNSLDSLRTAVERTRAAGIPHDIQYADIDHMSERRDFTVDDQNFAGLQEYFHQLREGGMRTIIILDPALVSNYSNYEPYERMKAVGGFIKWPSDSSVTIPPDFADDDGSIFGYVWPQGKTVFPDFFKAETRRVWKELIVKHRGRIDFDGLWIDMNEPAVFGTNEERPFNWPEDAKPYWSLKCPISKLDDPPYRTGAAFNFDTPGRYGRLSDKTLCMVARQGQNNEYRHYDVHNLYGWSQIPSTLEALRQATGERGIVFSRSTFVGSGKHAGHWLGDNLSSWGDLRASIPGILEFNLYGFPYDNLKKYNQTWVRRPPKGLVEIIGRLTQAVALYRTGADICGHFGTASAELCKRWMQLGAFYTFSRNHNAIGNRDQDPGNFNEEVSRVSREAMETRYRLLPFLYTLFYRATTRGGTVIRPLHHEFPTVPGALWNSRQFMWGAELLISPVLEPNVTSLTYFVPPGKWYDFYTGKSLTAGEGGVMRTVPVQSDSRTELLVRAGSIIPLQDPALNTTYSRKNPMELLAFLKDGADGGYEASGELFWDDGVSIDTWETGDYCFAQYELNKGSLRADIRQNNAPDTDSISFTRIKIMGLKSKPVYVELTDETNSRTVPIQWQYDEKVQKLSIDGMAVPLSVSFTLRWTNADFDTAYLDCWPERQGGVDLPSATTCAQRGCQWLGDGKSLVGPTPPCVYTTPDPDQKNIVHGYKVDGQFYESALGQSARLTNLGGGPFGDDLDNIIFAVEEHGNDVLRFTFTTEDGARYQVPMDLNLPSVKASDPKYKFEVVSLEPFYFRVIRRSTGAVLFDTSIGGLVLEDQFMQIATRLPTENVYGMGENVHSTLRRRFSYDTYPIFGRDQPTVGSDAFRNHFNHYGTHPFYECVEEDGSAHGVLLMNSNAQDYQFTPLPALTYRTIGGILDFYIFLGPSPEAVVQQYTGAIGRPVMPPYWALGFQLCKYGYNSLDNLRTAVERTRDAGIPHDVQYADIDHMSERRDFTIDNESFAGLPEYFRQLRDGGMRTIIILDPALIGNNTDYEPYERIKAISGFIKWPNDTGYTVPAGSWDDDGSILGYVWPQGKTVFPDFFKDAVRQEWKKLIQEHRARIDFDGLWIDMNEPAVFGTNEERPFNWPEDAKPYWSLKCPVSKLDDPPYRTAAAYSYDSQSRRARLSDKTLCMTAVQGERNEYRHYDVHNLYGWSQTPPTLDGLRNAIGNRGIVVTRSTFVGSGKYAGHWLGDNASGWDDLRASIIGIQEFNLFGITYTGADICGHFGTASAELCKRWMQLGAFYTFSRNHNAIGNRDQDPGNFDEEVSRLSREAMETRYWLLPYVYTLLHQAHVNGGTVIRPIFHEFPTDKTTLNINTQFMWGAALLISPIVYPNATELTYYIPKGRWYDFYTGAVITETGMSEKTIPVKSDSPVQLAVRAGYILPMQAPARNTTYSRQNPMKLLVALSVDDTKNGTADGTLFWDDGISLDTYENGKYFEATFRAENRQMSMAISHYNNNVPEVDQLSFNAIDIYGVASPVRSITVKSTRISSGFTYDATNKVLHITQTVPLNQDFVISWE